MAIAVPRYTIEDLDRLADDGNRYELLDGVLLVTPAPTQAHQVIVARLLVRLAEGLRVAGVGRLVGPGAIAAPPRTQLQPDLLAYPATYPLSAKWEEIGEHWLAVEVLSRSSRMYDREFKRNAYLALGVREVWLVDRHARSVEVCRSSAASEIVRDVLRWEVPTANAEITVDLAGVFADLY